jgi:hypothetical protein
MLVSEKNISDNYYYLTSFIEFLYYITFMNPVYGVIKKNYCILCIIKIIIS